MPDPALTVPVAGVGRRPVGGLRRLCAQLPEAALLWSGGRICQVNEAARRLLGCSGRVVDARVLQSLLAVLPRVGTRSAAGVATVLRCDGELRTLRVSAARLHRIGHRAQIWLLHDITADSDAQARLQRSHDRLAQLSAAVDAEQQRRRRLAAQRVHDEVLQALAAIRMNLDTAAGRGAPGADGGAALQRSLDIALAAIASGRDIVRELGSPMLVELGLPAALEALVRDFAQRHRVSCSFRSRGLVTQDGPAATAALQCLYRVAEEALDNVARHARARRVRVCLAGDRRGGMSLQVCDDGVGMAAHDRGDPRAIGLPVLQLRLRALGGRLVLRSKPGGGTVLSARLPAGDAPPAADDAQRDAPESALTRFFYRAPVGLVQADIDGRIELMNPWAAGRLLPISPDGRLDNLFEVLAVAAPPLTAQAAALQAPDGVLCDGLRVPSAGSRPLWLTLNKQAGVRWLAVLAEAAPTEPSAAGSADVR